MAFIDLWESLQAALPFSGAKEYERALDDVFASFDPNAFRIGFAMWSTLTCLPSGNAPGVKPFYEEGMAATDSFLVVQPIPTADTQGTRTNPLSMFRKYQERIAAARELLAELSRQQSLFKETLKEERNAQSQLEKELQARQKRIAIKEEAVEVLAVQKAQGFPWLARAYDDFFKLTDKATESALRTKVRPAAKAADVDDLLIGLAQEEEQASDDDAGYDTARQWLTDAEYQQLSAADKFQLALDRYWKSRRTRWQIGRDYERYIGYLYEREGFNVHYQGIIEGLDDLGRDLIVSKETIFPG